MRLVDVRVDVAESRVSPRALRLNQWPAAIRHLERGDILQTPRLEIAERPCRVRHVVRKSRQARHMADTVHGGLGSPGLPLKPRGAKATQRSAHAVEL